MKKSTAAWFQAPEKKHLILFVTVWVLGLLLQAAAWTDFFTRPIASSQAPYLMLLWVPATVGVIRLCRNYQRRSVAA